MKHKKSLFPVFAIAVLVLLTRAGLAADQCLYLSAGGKVSVFRIDPDAGRLTPHQAIELEGAGPMTASPDKRHLYVTASLQGDGGKSSKKKTPAIATFKVQCSGKLDRLELAPSGISSGYLKADNHGRFLAGNNYGEGKAMTWKLVDGVFRGESVQVIELEQKAHCAVFSPDNRFLLVPATGPNKVFQLRFDEETGSLSPNVPPSAPGPRGEKEARQPRHLVFHPEMHVVYTTLERERPGVGVWSWDPETGELEVIQNIVTQPSGFDGVITTADLHLTPDARFLYISSRDVTDRQARTGEDSIVAFSVDGESGRLGMIGHFPCEHVPRSFAVDETGRFVYVAGQMDDRLGAYRIDPKSGALERITQYETGQRPSWVHCMTP